MKREEVREYIRLNYGARKDQLKRKRSAPESKMEALLKNAGIFFIREHCSYSDCWDWYYTDFYIPSHRIAIEIDGKEHQSSKQKIKDKKKSLFLADERGFATVRFSNDEVLQINEISIDTIIRQYNSQNENSFFDSDHYAALLRSFKSSRKDFDSKFNGEFDNTIIAHHKELGCTFVFDSLFDMKIKTNMRYKDLIKGINNRHKQPNGYKSIFALSEEEFKRFMLLNPSL